MSGTSHGDAERTFAATTDDAGSTTTGTASGATAYTGTTDRGHDSGYIERADDRLGSDVAAPGGPTTSGVNVDDRLEGVEERHDHRLADPDEHVHELPTMGVDVDAALDRAVDENL